MAEEKRPRISVLTPSWNRAEYLKGVWRGLCAQTYRDFEWVVANDGSEDSTISVVSALAVKSDFPTTLINATVRVGKSFMDNLLVQAARGELVIWCDSDDVLLPEAIETLVRAWDDLPDELKCDYLGVSARATTDEGVLGCVMPSDADGWSWNRIYARLRSDLVILARTDLMRSTPFLEVDYLIPETSVWNIVGMRRSRFLDFPLKRVFYNQPLALSYSGKMQYNRGRAHAIARDYPYVKESLGVIGELARGVNYVRYCVHGDVPLPEAVKIWQGSAVSHIALVIGLIPAVLMVLRDRLRGVVEKTHIPFATALENVQVERMSWPESVE